jgi:hypothetical protein
MGMMIMPPNFYERFDDEEVKFVDVYYILDGQAYVA